MTENEIGKVEVDAALQVHREPIGSWKEGGCRWSAVPVPMVYEGLRFEEGFRVDIIVEGKVILELKSVEQIGKVHAKQVFTYLKLKGLKLGFVLNFGAKVMKEGIERVVRGLSEQNLGVLA